MVRSLTTLLLAASLLLSCNKEEEKNGYNPPAEASQTLLVYLPGRQLIWYYKQNIEDLKASITPSMPGSGRIVLCYQPTQNDQAELIELYYDSRTAQAEIHHLKSYTAFDAAETASVKQILSDVAAIAPARRYGLQIGCHGKAWVPAAQSMLQQRMGAAYAAEEALWTPAPGALPTRTFGDPGYELDIVQLAEAIQGSKFDPEFLLFDACFMANIETLYDLRNVTDYIIAAPCEIMAAGFPFRRTTPYLFTEGGNYDLAEVCYEFWYFYMYDWNSVPYNAQSGCISLCVTAELDELAAAMQRVVAAGRHEAEVPLQYYEGMSSHLFYDLGQYVAQTCNDAALRTAFQTQLERAFPTESCLNTPAFYSAYNKMMNPIAAGAYSGVSVSEPSTRLVESNRQTAWYRATHR